MPCSCHHHDSCECHDEHHEHSALESSDRKRLIITIIRLAISLTLAFLALFLFTEDWGDAHLGEGAGLWLNLSLNIVAWIVGGYDIVIEGFKDAFGEKNPFNENTLMTVASIGAFCLRFFGSEHNEFFEAVMIVSLYQIGEMFEDFATERSHKAIENALGLRAKVAHLVRGEKIEQVPPESLVVNDEVLVKVGEIVPADGTVIKGSGELDVSSLTGEFEPVPVADGSVINSGTILRSGSIFVRVNKSYEDGTVYKILRLVEESEAQKSKADRFIAKFARFYTPAVVILALLLAVLPPLFLGLSDPAVWSHWIYVAVSLLVISCPCAVVVSVPLTYFAGIGLASKRGILVKGAAYFDKLNDLGLLVTDKTGTLTEGRFSVAQKVPVGLDQASFDRYLAAAESRSNHHIAKAILAGAPNPPVTDSFDEIAGLGTVSTFEGKRLLAGNRALLSKEGVTVPEVEAIGTVVFLSVDGVYSGYVILRDAPRASAKALVEGLKKRGIDTLLLTGDKRESAALFASEVGIDDYEAELLPKNKTDLLRDRIASSSRSVAFLGDGINDAPSIALADVGIAMGGAGSDMAIENANVVLMNDDPSKVLLAVDIAHKTRRRAWLDVAIALTVKLAVAVLSILFPYIASGMELPMFIAVLSDTGLLAALIVFSVSLLWSKKK